MNVKKTSPKKSRLTLSSAKIRVFILQIVALLLSTIVGYFTWLHTIVDNEQQQLDQLSQKNVRYQQQVVQNYLDSLVEKARLYSHDEGLSAGLLSSDHGGLNNYQNKLKENIANLKSVRFFELNQAQIDSTGIPVNFIAMDMINRSEKGEEVYPEAVRHKTENAWLIAFVVPIYQNINDRAMGRSTVVPETTNSVAEKREETAEEKIIGTMYLAVTTEALQLQLSSLDQTLGQTQVLQSTTDKKFTAFLTVGNTGNYPTKQLAVANSHWQLGYTPSIVSYLQVKQPRTLAVLIITAVTLLLMTLCWFVARLINQRLKSSAVSPSPSTNFTTKHSGIAHLSTKSVSPADSLLDLELSEEDQSLLDGRGMDSGLNEEEIAVADQHPKYNLPDTIFRAYDIRGIVDEQLTCELATMIGRAFASEVLDKGEKTIFVGRDGRTHSPKIAHAFTQGILSTGCNTIDLGLVPTPLMNFATLDTKKTSSGAMVTASHNPKEYNGFKFVIKGRTLVDRDMQAIKNNVASGNFHVGQGHTESQDISQHYIERIFSDVALVGSLHVVIDAANGSTSAIAPALFEELGCTVTRLFCEVDGNFPNHDPDPSVAANLQPLIDKVIQQKADLGLAFDGDGDRLVVVTPKGKVIWPDQLMMLFAEDIVSRNPGCDVIYDVKSTRLLDQIITRCGGRPIMWKTGHANMKTKMRDTGALLGGEFSGHLFFKERWFGFDDGMYAAARLLEIITLENRDIDDIFEAFPTLISTDEIKIPIEEEKKFTVIESLLATADFANGKKLTIDGIRVDFPKGWGLIRASNTSAALTLRFEAETEEALESIKGLFKHQLNKVSPTLSVHF